MCVVLAQYQNHPSHIHFTAVKQMVGYLRLHPDVPLTFDCSRFLDTVGSFEIDIDHLDPLQIKFLGPESYHVASIQLLQAHYPAYNLSVAAMDIPEANDRIHFVAPNTTAKERAEVPPPKTPDKNTPHIGPHDTEAFIPSKPTDVAFGPDSKAPYTESFVDANLPGGIFEKTPYLGFAISMSGTCIFPFCRKCDTAIQRILQKQK
jgi:hypothetical protein